jgi:hypothetical protein
MIMKRFLYVFLMCASAWAQQTANTPELKSSFSQEILKATSPAHAEQMIASTNNRVNVRWYGARGDGRTDDTAAIQAAINNMPGNPANTNSHLKNAVNGFTVPGQKLYFPPGAYRISDTILITDNVSLEGDGRGSMLVASPELKKVMFHINPRQYISHIISGLSFLNTNAVGMPFIKVTTTATPRTVYINALYENCWFTTRSREAIQWYADIASADQNYMNRIVGCMFHGGGVLMTNVGDSISFIRNTFEGSSGNMDPVTDRQIAIDFETITSSGKCLISENTITTPGGIIIRGSSFGNMSDNFFEYNNDNNYAEAMVTFIDDSAMTELGHTPMSGWNIGPGNSFGFNGKTHGSRIKYAVHWEGYGLRMFNNIIGFPHNEKTVHAPIFITKSPTTTLANGTKSGGATGNNLVCNNFIRPTTIREVEGDGKWHLITQNSIAYVLPAMTQLGMNMANGTNAMENPILFAPSSYGTNVQGATLTLMGGRPTGSGASGIIKLSNWLPESNGTELSMHRVDALTVSGSNVTANGPLAAGKLTATNINVSNSIMGPMARTLIDNIATPLFKIKLAEGTHSGGQIFYTIAVTGADGQQTRSGIANWSVNLAKSGAFTASINGLPQVESSALSGGTLTDAWSITTASGTATIKLKVDSDRKGITAENITYTLINNSSNPVVFE